MGRWLKLGGRRWNHCALLMRLAAEPGETAGLCLRERRWKRLWCLLAWPGTVGERSCGALGDRSAVCPLVWAMWHPTSGCLWRCGCLSCLVTYRWAAVEASMSTPTGPGTSIPGR